MKRFALASLVLMAAACGSEPRERNRACTGLDVQVLDSAVAPPANVSARVRVVDCRGAPLHARLDASNFQLTEDDKPVSAEEASRLVLPTKRARAQRTLIALDLSGSIVRSGLRAPMIAGAKKLALTLLQDAEPERDHKIALFGFDGRPDLVPFTFFSNDADELRAGLAAADSATLVDDSTNLNGAVVSALGVLDHAVEAAPGDPSPVAHGALVVFTDGQDLAGRVSDQAMRRAVEETPHSTLAVGVGLAADRDTLARIGKTHTAIASGPDQVIEAFDEIADELRARSETDYIVSYCSPARAGSRRLELRVSYGELWGEASIEFDAGGFGAGCAPEDTALR